MSSHTVPVYHGYMTADDWYPHDPLTALLPGGHPVDATLHQVAVKEAKLLLRAAIACHQGEQGEQGEEEHGKGRRWNGLISGIAVWV